jgi:hypothetical protein
LPLTGLNVNDKKRAKFRQLLNVFIALHDNEKISALISDKQSWREFISVNGIPSDAGICHCDEHLLPPRGANQRKKWFLATAAQFN